MPTLTYHARRGELETYFDKTAVDAWSKLTSDAPVGSIRATVRAGRDRMRATLLEWLPKDLTGIRILDAGCGTGVLATEAARRGAQVVAIDLSPTLVELARVRRPDDLGPGSVEFRVGDMLDPALGTFDYVVAMDSLVHYRPQDTVRVLEGLAPRTRAGILFTFAPRTPALTLMHAVGRLFPRGDRAPAIEPVSHEELRRLVGIAPALAGWHPGRTLRIDTRFYKSQAMEIAPA
jgi:magnesium-protoporphyrin O-methyltransferase